MVSPGSTWASFLPSAELAALAAAARSCIAVAVSHDQFVGYSLYFLRYASPQAAFAAVFGNVLM